MGLFAPRRAEPGVIMGCLPDGTILRHRDGRPLLAVGPTGCGKTSTVLVPTLFEYDQSAIVWDLKGMLAQTTGAARERLGSDVIVLDICRPGGVCYNPLMGIRKGPYLVPDAQKAARLMLDDENAGIWRNAAVGYLTAVFIHVLLSAPDADKTLLGVSKHIARGDDGTREMLQSPHPTVRRAAQRITDKNFDALVKPPDKAKGFAERTMGGGSGGSMSMRQSVYFTAGARFEDFEFEILAEKTSRSDFTMSDLCCRDRPVTLYVIARPNDAENYMRVFRLIVVQLMEHLLEEVHVMPDGKAKRWKVLFAIDEFLNFNILEMSRWLTFVREYGVLPVFLAQSAEDVHLMYGPKLTANLPTMQFTPMSGREAKILETNLGEAIEQLPTTTVSKKGFMEPPTISRGLKTERRALESAAALMELEPHEIRITGHGPPIRALGLRPWEIPQWKALYGPPTREWTPNPDASPWLGSAAKPLPPLIV